HVLRGVFLHDHVDGRRKLDVPAHVVAVGVRVDDGGDWFGCQVTDGLHDRLSPLGQLRVDDDDAGRADKDGGVAATTLQHEEVVAELLDLHDLWRRLRGSTGRRLL